MVNIVKASGKSESFSEEKLRLSIQRAGIPKELEDKVVNHIQEILYENIPTSEIYRHLTEFLEKSSLPFSKSKYGLKQSVMDLGPTGYPFEDFIAEVFKTLGFRVETRRILNGTCVTHEVDIVAKKDKTHAMVECKFHNSLGIKTDVHVALYSKARFDDVKALNGLNEAWIVTNTKITSEAINYALCTGLKIISWNYPARGNIRDLIENSGLTPVTMLSSLSSVQKQKLLENHFVLCKTVSKSPSCLDDLGLTEDKKNKILEEANYVLGNFKH